MSARLCMPPSLVSCTCQVTGLGSQTGYPKQARWLDRDTNGCLNLQRIGESMQRPLELCQWEGLAALPPVGDEYQQRYELVNDRQPKGKQRLHRAAECRRGIDGRAHNNAQALVVCKGC
ncbi:hypothetical protein QJQ45_005242 [Haematococcus lacustris]|nr:hypothetical protein QJQ45_005242 [Haematococcus lacustris]